ncbi:peptidoglycan glycosyltransferase [Pueribacillus theae]|uniref:Peptidoglycan glycosyltransferase n=1 Tax=Pueribacillus theae TaxID=2171751 RepID=A0A2U1JXD8_9BACI|nr:transglycosylase domain-containing protein [Pueribacillus theae]PWA09468.1 peptidoglycan glycosyltransferase [Pueribacillus theae]
MKEYFSKARNAYKAFMNKLSELGIIKGASIATKVVWNLFLIFITFGLMAAFFAFGVGAGYFASLVKDEQVESYENMKERIYNYEVSSQVYFADNKLLGNLRSDLERKEVKVEDVSDYAKQAIIATEDNYFYDHKGIVPKALIRATFQELTNSSVQTGGSTLTQQLVKNQILTNEVSFERKAKEILLAMRLERAIDKHDILEAYLNIVSFGRNSTGQNIAGIEAAAQGIFGVSAKDLNLPQAAFIAGLPQNPFSYTPFNNDGTVKKSLEPGLKRMKTVLLRMYMEGFIDKKQYNEAVAYDVKANLAKPKPIPQKTYPYFHFEVEKRATEVLASTFADENGHDGKSMRANYALYESMIYESRITGKSMEEVAKKRGVNLQDIKKDYEFFSEYVENADNLIRRKGYQIHTTVKKDIYDAMQKAKDGVLDNPSYFQAPKTALRTDPKTGEKVSKKYPMEVGAILIENSTGKILSFVGGRDYEESQLNHATQAYRSNGSTMKPLLDYAPAMELGKVQPGYMLADTPLNHNGWKPRNYGGGYKGLVTTREALAKSINVPAARAYLMMDPYEATGYLEKMGFTSLMSVDRYNRSMALGALQRGVTVEENTNAYATFANGGTFHDAYLIEKIVDNHGKVIYEHKAKPVEVFSPQTAYLTIDMMRDVLRGGGTASRVPSYLKFRTDWAGKTGTSQDWKDSWFVATNPNVTLGVWTGYDKPMSLDRSNYAHRTQRIWALLANSAYDVNSDLIAPNKRFAMPSGIVRRSICGISGHLASEMCKKAGLVKTDLFNAKFAPKKVDDSLDLVQYVVINGKNYLALDSTPSEFTKQGVNLKVDSLNGVDIKNMLPNNWRSMDGVATEKAKENGKTPDPVSGLNVKGNTLTWAKHGESDIVGYRIYRAQDETNNFKLVGSVATFSNSNSYVISESASAYYVTAVDVAGKESSPSEKMIVGNWSKEKTQEEETAKKPEKQEQKSETKEKQKAEEKSKQETDKKNNENKNEKPKDQKQEDKEKKPDSD